MRIATRRKSALLTLPLLLALSLGACSSPASQSDQTQPDQTQSDSSQSTPAPAAGETTTLQISAAASLKSVFEPLIEAFEQEHPDIKIASVNFDGSPTLVEQIVAGDPVDVFLSADTKNMDNLAEQGEVAGEPEIFATNSITLAAPAANPAGLKELGDIESSDVAIVTCAPEVPCGAATGRLLESENITIDPVSLEQNVSAVAAKLAADEADGGFIYQTDVLANDGKIIAIDTPAIDPNQYPIAVVKSSKNQEAAQTFVDFMLSPKALEILKEFGFGAP